MKVKFPWLNKYKMLGVVVASSLHSQPSSFIKTDKFSIHFPSSLRKNIVSSGIPCASEKQQQQHWTKPSPHVVWLTTPGASLRIIPSPRKGWRGRLGTQAIPSLPRCKIHFLPSLGFPSLLPTCLITCYQGTWKAEKNKTLQSFLLNCPSAGERASKN